MIPTATSRSASVLRPSFFQVMALVFAAVIIYGFSFTIHDNLLYPPYPRPAILYVHAVVFSAWVVFFFAQVTLVRSQRVDLHRRLGQWGLLHGATIPIVGVATAIAMTRLRVAHGELDAAGSFVVPFFDMIAFTSCFALGLAMRKRPEYHRRLMWMATAALTAAAFGRMPAFDYGEWFYAGVDALILIGALRDRVVLGLVHPVYKYGLPAMISGQLLAAYVRGSGWWLEIAPKLFQ
jgi:hypothetical protein